MARHLDEQVAASRGGIVAGKLVSPVLYAPAVTTYTFRVCR